MYVKELTYTDFTGIERKEKFRFNMTKTELLDMSLDNNGTYGEKIQNMVDANDNIPMVDVFKDLLLKAYGELSDDGRYFLKEDDNGRPLWRKFKQSAAYPELFLLFGQDEDAAAEFINGVIPRDMATELAKTKANGLPVND